MEQTLPPNEKAAPAPERLRNRSVTLTEELRETLEAQIVSGALKPGTRLDEAELVERYKVSRTPVREALRALAGTGLVEMKGPNGVCVASLSMPVIIEMFQMMSVLEGLCARYAARRATPEQRKQLLQIQEELKALVDSDNRDFFYQVNQRFHDALYDASNTHHLSTQTRLLRKRVSFYRRYVTYQPGRMLSTIGEHQAIIDAIQRNDPEAAFSAAATHVTLLQDDMVDLISAVSVHMPV